MMFMKKGLLILLAILGIAIFFMTKNMKNSLKGKKGNQAEKITESIPTISPTKTKVDQVQTKNNLPLAQSKDEEEEYEPEETPTPHTSTHSTEINQNPNIHKSMETAPIAVTPPPSVHHATPAPTGPVYVQPTAPPVEKLAPLHVKP
jgi:hypothetical protein